MTKRLDMGTPTDPLHKVDCSALLGAKIIRCSPECCAIAINNKEPGAAAVTILALGEHFEQELPLALAYFGCELVLRDPSRSEGVLGRKPHNVHSERR